MKMWKVGIVFCVLCLCLNEVQAQSTASLRVSAEMRPVNKKGVRASYLLAQQYMHVRNDSALHYAGQAVQWSAKFGFDTMHVKSLTILATIESLEGEFEASLAHAREAGRIALATGQEGFMGHYYSICGRYFKYLQQYDSALHYTIKYDQWLEERGRHSRRFLPHLGLANMYYNLGDSEKADTHIERSLDFARIEKKPMDYLYVLSEAIAQYEMQGRYTEASVLTEEYLDFKVEQGDISEVVEIPQHSNIRRPGVSFEEEESQLLKYIPVHESLGHWFALAQACYRLANMYVERNEPLRAIPLYTRGMKAADSLDLDPLRYNMHSGLHHAYDDAGMPAKALAHHEQKFGLRESIRDMERQALLNDLEVKYETQQKELDLAAAEIELQSVHQRQQLLGGGAIALVCILAALLYAFLSKQKLNRRLVEQNTIITRALDEKDILLREIHHRVKNNLQMISALLYLHGKSVGEGSAQQALLESQNRVQSMAMIHQNLYQEEDLLGVAVKDYLDRLLDHLTASYSVEKRRIRIESDVQVGHLDVDMVIPLALIINELISNSLKYAFRDGREGVVEVFVGESDGQVEVQVKDNGIGLPQNFALESDGNFGYKLVRILAEKLGASLSASSQDGTVVTLYIPIGKAA